MDDITYLILRDAKQSYKKLHRKKWYSALLSSIVLCLSYMGIVFSIANGIENHWKSFVVSSILFVGSAIFYRHNLKQSTESKQQISDIKQYLTETLKILDNYQVERQSELKQIICLINANIEKRKSSIDKLIVLGINWLNVLFFVPMITFILQVLKKVKFNNINQMFSVFKVFVLTLLLLVLFEIMVKIFGSSVSEQDKNAVRVLKDCLKMWQHNWKPMKFAAIMVGDNLPEDEKTESCKCEVTFNLDEQGEIETVQVNGKTFKRTDE